MNKAEQILAALGGSDIAAIKSAQEKVARISQEVGGALYAQQAEAGDLRDQLLREAAFVEALADDRQHALDVAVAASRGGIDDQADDADEDADDEAADDAAGEDDDI